MFTKVGRVTYAGTNKIIVKNADTLFLEVESQKYDMSKFHNEKVKVTIEVI